MQARKLIGALGGLAPALNLDFLSGVLDPRITFARASGGTYFNSAGVLTLQASSNVPRFDHDPVTFAPLGLLMEEQRTNLLTYSSDCSTGVGPWNTSFSSGTVTASSVTETTNPDGTLSQTLLVMENTSYGRLTAGASSPFYTGAGSATASVFLKYKSGTTRISVRLREATVGAVRAELTFDTQTGAYVSSSAGTYSIKQGASGWWRVSVTGTTTADCSLWITDHLYSGAGVTGSYYVWGAQVEPGAFPTSYIPTVGAAATRGAETAYINSTIMAPIFNSTEGTLAAETTPGMLNSIASAYPLMARFDDGGSNNSINIFYHTLSAEYSADIVSGGVNQGGSGGGSGMVNGTPAKLAFAFTTNNLRGSVNGGAPGLDTVATMPSFVGGVQLNIGSAGAGTLNTAINSSMRAHIQRIRYFNTALPDSTLRALTT